VLQAQPAKPLYRSAIALLQTGGLQMVRNCMQVTKQPAGHLAKTFQEPGS
jgi:hypothetical protein